MITLDLSKAYSFMDKVLKPAMEAKAQAARATLLGRSGAGNDFLGWLDLPVTYDREEFARIKAAAAKIREDSDVLVVIGIGGSYLGARAAVEFLGHPFAQAVGAAERKGPAIWFCGNQISTVYMKGLLEALEGKRVSLNVISKSGTTTEPAIAFRILKQYLEERVGKAEAAKRIYATTDKKRGALKQLADQEGYECFVVPDDVGGRYSVLTAVGLLPIAAAGIDIDALMAGAAAEREACLKEGCAAEQYAVYRNCFLAQGKNVEVLANYEPSLHYIGEWWKQLYGESEGKNGKGIFPAAVDLTTDLHSMGQYIQDGQRMLTETVLNVADCGSELLMEAAESDLDGLNYLAGKPLSFVNRCAGRGTALAHNDGGVPVAELGIPAFSPEALGALFYFFEFACGLSGYMLGVNPFDQPGVESYKKNMFALLGKPGYEAARAELEKRL